MAVSTCTENSFVTQMSTEGDLYNILISDILVRIVTVFYDENWLTCIFLKIGLN